MSDKILKIIAYILAALCTALLIVNIICMKEAYGMEMPYLIPDSAVEVTGCGFSTVNADVLNVRSLPDMGGEIIGRAEYGEHVYKVLLCGDWALIRRMGYEFPSGWVNCKYLQ